MKQKAGSNMLVSCLPNYTTLKIAGTYSSETSVDFQWATRRDIQKDKM
jgi:hypothetical protein